MIRILIFTLMLVPGYSYAAPQNFEQAKIELRQHVYHDQNQSGHLGTLYCGCDWQWVGRSGGRIDMSSCGYKTRAQQNRAERIEYEHIVPASSMGRTRLCWQDGGRKNCQRTDPIFNLMEADMFNLSPTVGEVNTDRSNYRFGVLPGASRIHGDCDFKVDFQYRVAEPRNDVKGLIARTYFYMHDRYDLPMSEQQQRLYMSWDRQFPTSSWERERHNRIAVRMGYINPFVTGERQWNLGHRNSGEGLMNDIPPTHPAYSYPDHKERSPISSARTDETGIVRGNRNSFVYHLPDACSSYDRIAPHNIVEFKSEAEAISSGYRKAGNCK